jgi:predicted phage tail protein
MTKISIHGILGKKFGKSFFIKINTAASAIKAIDANKEGFIQEIKKLSEKGFNYFVVIDGQFAENENEFIENKKIKTIDIVPSICGSGGAVVSWATSTAVADFTIGQAVSAFLINAAISAAISIGISFIMNALQKQTEPPRTAGAVAVGGVTSMLEAQGKSYVFNNMQNIASQGSALPIGYGRFKVASYLIEANIKNYGSNESLNSQFSTTNLSIATDLLN